jgi:hypothetical protein
VVRMQSAGHFAICMHQQYHFKSQAGGLRGATYRTLTGHHKSYLTHRVRRYVSVRIADNGEQLTKFVQQWSGDFHVLLYPHCLPCKQYIRYKRQRQQLHAVEHHLTSAGILRPCTELHRSSEKYYRYSDIVQRIRMKFFKKSNDPGLLRPTTTRKTLDFASAVNSNPGMMVRAGQSSQFKTVIDTR